MAVRTETKVLKSHNCWCLQDCYSKKEIFCRLWWCKQ